MNLGTLLYVGTKLVAMATLYVGVTKSRRALFLVTYSLRLKFFGNLVSKLKGLGHSKCYSGFWTGNYSGSKREGEFPHYCHYFITSLQHLVMYTSDSARGDLYNSLSLQI